MRNAKSIKIPLLLILFFVISICPLFFYSLKKADVFVMLSFYLNGTIFAFHVCRETKKHSLSIELIIWLFMFFFFFLAPVVQYLIGEFSWRGFFSSDELLLINGCVFLSACFFDCGKFLSKRVKILRSKKQKSFISDAFVFSKATKAATCIIMVLLALWSVSKTGISGIVVSRDDAVNAFYSGSNSSVTLLVQSFIPAFMAYVVAETAQEYRNTKKGLVRLIISLVCILICFFPTSIPRYKMATIYGTFFVVLFPQINKKSRFTWFFVLIMFFVFPILSNIRHSLLDADVSGLFTNVYDSFAKADYDAYRMLGSAIRYVRNVGCCWGSQLLGALLFFVPRSVWPGKPEGSGAMLIKRELGKKAFSNVSCPFVAEGVLNFGLLGLLLFPLLLGIFVSKSDTKYWENYDGKTKFAPYLLLVFMMFFIMRGDLMSSFSYTLGFIVTGLILRIFTLKRQRINENGKIT